MENRLRSLFRLLGMGVAIGSSVWVLIHLVTFSFAGWIVVGEPNRIVLFAEIALVSVGLASFLSNLEVR